MVNSTAMRKASASTRIESHRPRLCSRSLAFDSEPDTVDPRSEAVLTVAFGRAVFSESATLAVDEPELAATYTLVTRPALPDRLWATSSGMYTLAAVSAAEVPEEMMPITVTSCVVPSDFPSVMVLPTPSEADDA